MPMTPGMPLAQRLVVEALGTALLAAAVVGSGMLAGGNAALTLLLNALATAATLFVLIEWLGPLSGAHFDPAISLAMAWRGDLAPGAATAYGLTQFVAALVRVGTANLMSGTPAYAAATFARGDAGPLLGEFLATFGLVGVVWTCSRLRPHSLSAVVAAYVASIFWTTPSGFANPAIAFARAFTDTDAGIQISPPRPS